MAAGAVVLAVFARDVDRGVALRRCAGGSKRAKIACLYQSDPLTLVTSSLIDFFL